MDSREIDNITQRSKFLLTMLARCVRYADWCKLNDRSKSREVETYKLQLALIRRISRHLLDRNLTLCSMK